MNRSNHILFLIPFLLGIFSGTYGKNPEPTNVIIISVDTLRADHLSCYGYPRRLTPVIDTLAKDGIRFSRSFTVTPLTAPSLSSMLTSLPPHKNGTKKNGLGIFKYIRTLPYYLKKRGYHSAAFISNWPLRKKLSKLNRDFDSYNEIFTRKRYLGLLNSEGKADIVTERAIKWLDENYQKKFFLWVHYTDPHRKYFFHKDFNPDFDKLKDAHFPPRTRLFLIKKYDTEIAYTDFYIGQLIKNIKKLGLYRKALIIFTADHGESFGEHKYFKHGKHLYNSTLNIPLIVKLPWNRKKDSVNNHNVSIMDITPTILSILKIPIPDHMEGISLLATDPGRHLYFETYHGNASFLKRSYKYQLKITPIRFGIISGSIKIIKSMKSRKKKLYNLKTDWFENHNLARLINHDYSRLYSQLIKYSMKVKEYIKYTKRRFRKNSQISKEDYKKLKSLGYF